MQPVIKRIVRLFIALAMIAVGATHFANPEPFIRIVPSILPEPRLLVLISGAFEVAGGFGLLWPQTRRLASLGLIALFIAVFPANINMAINEIQMQPGDTMPVWAMWLRLPFQAIFIALAWWVGKDKKIS
tara:strand:- start:27163 stop:27552 length:390 start_codon:yes stop_codon:yes gene_type:complete